MDLSKSYSNKGECGEIIQQLEQTGTIRYIYGSILINVSNRIISNTMSNVVIYGSHLQIVTDRAIHDELKERHLELFPPAIVVTPDVLALHHTPRYSNYLQHIHFKSPNTVWYILPLGSYGAIDGYHCNGIRYGLERGDYISLPQIKPLTGE